MIGYQPADCRSPYLDHRVSADGPTQESGGFVAKLDGSTLEVECFVAKLDGSSGQVEWFIGPSWATT